MHLWQQGGQPQQAYPAQAYGAGYGVQGAGSPAQAAAPGVQDPAAAYAEWERQYGAQ